MDKGRITHQGTYDELVAQGVSFRSLTTGASSDGAAGGSTDSAATGAGAGAGAGAGSGAGASGAGTGGGGGMETTIKGAGEEAEGAEEEDTLAAVYDHDRSIPEAVLLEKGRTIDDEDRVRGTVGWSVYKNYLISLGGGSSTGPTRWSQVVQRLAVLLVLSVALHALGPLTDVWLAMWTSAVDTEGEAANNTLYLVLYVVITLLYSVTSLARNLYWFHASYLASKRIHKEMLWSILRAPMAWFHGTTQVRKAPQHMLRLVHRRCFLTLQVLLFWFVLFVDLLQGRILNRFSSDLNCVDSQLPDEANDSLLSVMSVSCQGGRGG